MFKGLQSNRWTEVLVEREMPRDGKFILVYLGLPFLRDIPPLFSGYTNVDENRWAVGNNV